MEIKEVRLRGVNWINLSAQEAVADYCEQGNRRVTKWWGFPSLPSQKVCSVELVTSWPAMYIYFIYNAASQMFMCLRCARRF
jgi:hypothetical protein